MINRYWNRMYLFIIFSWRYNSVWSMGCQSIAGLTATYPLTEEKYPSCVFSSSRPTAFAGFLEQYYCYKPAASQNIHYAGLKPTLTLAENVSPTGNRISAAFNTSSAKKHTFSAWPQGWINYRINCKECTTLNISCTYSGLLSPIWTGIWNSKILDHLRSLSDLFLRFLQNASLTICSMPYDLHLCACLALNSCICGDNQICLLYLYFRIMHARGVTDILSPCLQILILISS